MRPDMEPNRKSQNKKNVFESKAFGILLNITYCSRKTNIFVAYKLHHFHEDMNH